MKQHLLILTFITSLSAACIDVLTPVGNTHAQMRLLEQDLGDICEALPFNDDFNWGALTHHAVAKSLIRLKSPSVYAMLHRLEKIESYNDISMNIRTLLNQDMDSQKYSIQKDHMKTITHNLNDLWQMLPLF